eukprot:TRINITY_DN980_c0_g1_i2.p1 TRINITY_DN980_c0_g1~~TRINITY_DN980_c0_g1_i2.p1  ORF type:complete len:209 (+),score=53.51 TRINITY_DN980_c0_g1_i2:70-627(+)
MVDIRDLENHTPLLLAAGTNKETTGHVEVVKYLIEKGADVNATDDGQYTSLHLASLNLNYSIAQALLEAKCNVDPVNIDKFTPLHSACEQNNERLVQLLINYGADPTRKDARGKSPLDLARRAGLTIDLRQQEPQHIHLSEGQPQHTEQTTTTTTTITINNSDPDPTVGAEELLKAIAQETETHD